MTQRQSNNQWSGGIAAHPAPKIPSAKIRWKSSRQNFWDQDGILLIFQRAKLSARSITHLCCCNWRTFWRKNAAGRSPKESCSCMKMSQVTGHLQPRRNWSIWASNLLIAHPILRIWPRRTTTCSLDWKKIERSPFFFQRGGHCCRRNLVGRTTFWISFFEWLVTD